MFPRNIYKVLSVNGKLQKAEVGVKIPDELKYVPISPSKRKEKKEKKSPKIQSKAKKLSLADVEGSSDDEIKPQVHRNYLITANVNVLQYIIDKKVRSYRDSNSDCGIQSPE